MSFLLRCTLTKPGDVTVQLPWSLVRVQSAPTTGGVAIAIDCVVPFTTEAHPDKVKERTATPASARNFIECPFLGKARYSRFSSGDNPLFPSSAQERRDFEAFC